MNAELKRIAKHNLVNAEDNLCRARASADHFPKDWQWGHSGKTLGQIIAEYEEHVKEAREALIEAGGEG